MTKNNISKQENANNIFSEDLNHSIIIQKMQIMPEEDMLLWAKIEMKKFPKMTTRSTLFYKCISQF